MGYVGNQFSLHTLVLEFVLYHNAGGFRNIIYICSQSVKLSLYSLRIFFYRNLPVQISAFYLGHTFFDIGKLLHHPRYKDKNQHYYNRQSKPGCTQKGSCHKYSHNLEQGAVAFLESSLYSTEETSQLSVYPYHNSAYQGFFPELVSLKLLYQRQEAQHGQYNADRHSGDTQLNNE